MADSWSDSQFRGFHWFSLAVVASPWDPRAFGSSRGIALLDSVSTLHGTANLSLLLLPEYRGCRWLIEGVTLFVGYSFDEFRLRKIYMEVPGNVLEDQRSVTELFELEGTLRDHEWHQGRYWDTSILSLTRLGFEATLNRWTSHGDGRKNVSRQQHLSFDEFVEFVLGLGLPGIALDKPVMEDCELWPNGDVGSLGVFELFVSIEQLTGEQPPTTSSILRTVRDAYEYYLSLEGQAKRGTSGAGGVWDGEINR